MRASRSLNTAASPPRLADLNRASWNRIVAWLVHLDALQPVGPVWIGLDYSLPGVPS